MPQPLSSVSRIDFTDPGLCNKSSNEWGWKLEGIAHISKSMDCKWSLSLAIWHPGIVISPLSCVCMFMDKTHTKQCLVGISFTKIAGKKKLNRDERIEIWSYCAPKSGFVRNLWSRFYPFAFQTTAVCFCIFSSFASDHYLLRADTGIWGTLLSIVQWSV